MSWAGFNPVKHEKRCSFWAGSEKIQHSTSFLSPPPQSSPNPVSYPPDRTLDGRHEVPREERRDGSAGGDQAAAGARWQPGPREVTAWWRGTSSTDVATAAVPFSPVSLCLSFFSPPTLGFLLLVHDTSALGVIAKSSGAPMSALPGSQILPSSSTTTCILAACVYFILDG
jgi:hypothetical protein